MFSVLWVCGGDFGKKSPLFSHLKKPRSLPCSVSFGFSCSVHTAAPASPEAMAPSSGIVPCKLAKGQDGDVTEFLAKLGGFGHNDMVRRERARDGIM